MTCGGSVGEGYGPMIVSPRPFTAAEIKTKRIAVPGTLTTALPGAASVCSRHRNRSRSVRPDHSAGARRQVRSRPHHSRRPVDLRQVGTAPHCGSRQVVGEGDRPAVAAGRQCDSPGPWSGTDAGSHRSPAREHPVRTRSPRRGAVLRHAVRPRSRHVNRPTSSSACT